MSDYNGNGCFIGYQSFAEITNSNFKSKYQIDAHSFSGTGINCEYCRSLKIENCLFKNLSSETKGGAIKLLLIEKNSISIKSSSFEHLSATQGGSIYSDGSVLNVINCNFTFCAATGFKIDDEAEGGAIFSISLYDLVINSSKFESNNANISGGAIHWIGKQPFLINSTCR